MTNVWAGIEAVSTALAAAAAMLAGYFAKKAWDRERDAVKLLQQQRDEDRESATRAQAELVAAWVDQDVKTRNIFLRRFEVHVRNASHVPVYNVAYVLHHAPLFQADSRTQLASGIVSRVVPPSSTSYSVGIEKNDWHDDALTQDLDPSAFLVEVSFDDASGVRWTRDWNGSLSRYQPGGHAGTESSGT